MTKKVKEAQIFLCYTRKDLLKVEEFYQKLSDAGFRPWMDTKDILPGEDWKRVVIKTIRDLPIFLPCLSNNSVNKRGVIQEEIKEALEVWRQKLDDDIYLIPVRLERCEVPEALAKFQRVDLYQTGGFEQLFKAIRAGLEPFERKQPIWLRSQSLESLSEFDVKEMLHEKDFFHRNWYWMGKGVQHEYEETTSNGKKLIIDYITGLTWQKSGSDEIYSYEGTQAYIDNLNALSFASYSDWRLPTLEEAMSLMEPKRYGDLFIDPIFNKKQIVVCTCDKLNSSKSWVVSFDQGYCHEPHSGMIFFVRAVR